MQKNYTNDPDEMKRMKAELSIVDLALAAGWTIDRLESSQNHVVLRCAGEKINVSPGRQHGIREVFSSRDSRKASGTVIDFACFLTGSENIGQARAYLRPFLSAPPTRTRTAQDFVKEKMPADFTAEWASFKQYNNSGYLEGRGLTPETIAAFVDHIKYDNSGYSNVCFCHRSRGDVDKITGWEIRNGRRNGAPDFRGFTRNGNRTLFFGPALVGEIEKIVITESAIDAMSYYQFDSEGKHRTLYASLAGNPSKEQIDQIMELGLRLANANEIIIGTDADEPGDRMATLLLSALPPGIATRVRPRFSESEQRAGKKDWNDLVRLGRTTLDYEVGIESGGNA
jgi:hypothetical protein